MSLRSKCTQFNLKMKTIIYKIILAALIFLNMPAYAQILNFERDWATYFGDENIRLADSAIDKDGNIYFVGMIEANSTELPTTSGSYQPLFAGGTLDGFLVKMDAGGQIVWATYYGGEGEENITGITIDDNDKIYIIGYTSSATGIATPNSHQPNLIGVSNPFVAKFSSNGFREWATYYPGSTLLGSESGVRSSIDISYQPNYIQSPGNNLKTNIFIAKFNPESLTIQGHPISELKVFPNPNHGSFSITSGYGTIISVEVYSILGQHIEKSWTPINNGVQINHLGRGLYFVKVHLESGATKIAKVLIN